MQFARRGAPSSSLQKGTWHSGPFFAEPAVDFANLELADTNVVDHHTYRLDRELGVQVQIDPAAPAAVDGLTA